ncbi:hypothetical protein KCV06_g263, partial [Aureobasidium melanogenum]
MGDRGRKAWMTEIMEDLEDRVHNRDSKSFEAPESGPPSSSLGSFSRGPRAGKFLLEPFSALSLAILLTAAAARRLNFLDSLIRSPGGQLPTIVRIARIAVPESSTYAKHDHGHRNDLRDRPAGRMCGQRQQRQERRVSASASTSTLVDVRVGLVVLPECALETLMLQCMLATIKDRRSKYLSGGLSDRETTVHVDGLYIGLRSYEMRLNGEGQYRGMTSIVFTTLSLAGWSPSRGQVGRIQPTKRISTPDAQTPKKAAGAAKSRIQRTDDWLPFFFLLSSVGYSSLCAHYNSSSSPPPNDKSTPSKWLLPPYKPTAAKGAKKNQKVTKKFIINASQPTNDKIFDPSAFTTFLQSRIKVDGLTGNLGERITVTNLNDGKIEVVAHQEFSGRYLKYLTKKFLKKQQLRDWLRVVSTSKGVYELRFYNVVGENEEEDDDFRLRGNAYGWTDIVLDTSTIHLFPQTLLLLFIVMWQSCSVLSIVLRILIYLRYLVVTLSLHLQIPLLISSIITRVPTLAPGIRLQLMLVVSFHFKGVLWQLATELVMATGSVQLATPWCIHLSCIGFARSGDFMNLPRAIELASSRCVDARVRIFLDGSDCEVTAFVICDNSSSTK